MAWKRPDRPQEPTRLIARSPRPPARSRSLRIEQRPARAPARSARSPPGLPGVTDLRDADSAAIETASSATDGTRDSGAGRDISRNRASQRCTAIRQTRRGFPRPERIAATRLRVGVIRGGHARQARWATCAARPRAVWAERRPARAPARSARSPPGLPGVTDLRDADSAAIETASSATDGTRDSGAGRDISRNRASQRCTAIRQTRRGFPRPERIAATRLRVGVIRGGHARQSRRATCAARRRGARGGRPAVQTGAVRCAPARGLAERRSLLRSLARAGPINARSPVAVARALMWPGSDLTGHRNPLA